MDSLVVLISHDQLINDQGNIAHDSTTIVYIYIYPDFLYQTRVQQIRSCRTIMLEVIYP